MILKFGSPWGDAKHTFTKVDVLPKDKNVLVAHFVAEDEFGQRMEDYRSYMGVQREIAMQLCARAEHPAEKTASSTDAHEKYNESILEANTAAFYALKEAAAEHPSLSLKANPLLPLGYHIGKDEHFAIAIDHLIREGLVSDDDFPFHFIDDWSSQGTHNQPPSGNNSASDLSL
tara:strand:+ start:1643 stop:2164 length:522 start_codon:yes stop_codon:yes gene_type:complete